MVEEAERAVHWLAIPTCIDYWERLRLECSSLKTRFNPLFVQVRSWGWRDSLLDLFLALVLHEPDPL